jgi:hypothetical protein
MVTAKTGSSEESRSKLAGILSDVKYPGDKDHPQEKAKMGAAAPRNPSTPSAA